MTVSTKNILSGKNDFLERHANIVRKSNDTRKRDRGIYGMHCFAFEGTDQFCFVQVEENDGLGYVADRKGFVVAIQDQHLAGKGTTSVVGRIIVMKF